MTLEAGGPRIEWVHPLGLFRLRSVTGSSCSPLAKRGRCNVRWRPVWPLRSAVANPSRPNPACFLAGSAGLSASSALRPSFGQSSRAISVKCREPADREPPVHLVLGRASYALPICGHPGSHLGPPTSAWNRTRQVQSCAPAAASARRPPHTLTCVAADRGAVPRTISKRCGRRYSVGESTIESAVPPGPPEPGGQAGIKVNAVPRWGQNPNARWLLTLGISSYDLVDSLPFRYPFGNGPSSRATPPRSSVSECIRDRYPLVEGQLLPNGCGADDKSPQYRSRCWS